MAQKYKRDILMNVNRPQEKVLYPFYAACAMLLLCLIFFGYLFFKHPLLKESQSFHTLTYNYELGADLRVLMVVLISVVSATLFIVVYWAYKISNKILGPYSRILRELDEMVEGKRNKPLRVRDGDEMFGELLKRINTIIERKQ